MNWQTEQEDGDLIEQGAKVLQLLALAAGVFCVCGLLAAVWSVL